MQIKVCLLQWSVLNHLFLSLLLWHHPLASLQFSLLRHQLRKDITLLWGYQNETYKKNVKHQLKQIEDSPALSMTLSTCPSAAPLRKSIVSVTLFTLLAVQGTRLDATLCVWKLVRHSLIYSWHLCQSLPVHQMPRRTRPPIESHEQSNPFTRTH